MRKMKRILLWAILAPIVFASCQSGVTKTSDGIVVRVAQQAETDVKQVRLQVINDQIIRVTATPESKFANDSSLIIVEQTAPVPAFTVEETEGEVILKTTDVQARVNRSTGEVQFADANGKIVLQEQTGGGKTFRAINVEGTPGYELRQVWESPADEAFYGLGQHQSDEFNYKGKNEALFQYNTKVSIPMVISNKNYGVLWDNYSLSRFGNPKDYEQLYKVFDLYDAEGKSGGLTATYTGYSFRRPAPGEPRTPPQEQKIVQTEDSIFYEDNVAVGNLPMRNGNATYVGELAAKETGTYHFHLYYAGYVKVYINNELIVPERWRTSWNPNAYKFTVDMEKGKRVPIRVDWQGISYLGLRALAPVPKAEQEKLSIFSEMGSQIDYYYIAGSSMDDVIKGYRVLTGKSPIMPKWAMGYWQSRERYQNQDQLLSTFKEFRKRQIPIDNIVLDWFYWPEDSWGSHDFDKAKFPDPKAMLDSVHNMGGHFMISVWPKFYASTEHFKEFQRNGWMYMQAVNDSIHDWVGRGGYVGSFYDAYAAGARKLFWKQVEDKLYHYGIDAWWMDASEPNIQDCTPMDYRKKLQGPTALGPSTQYFNAYALMNAQAIYTGLRNIDPNRRVFQLTRSGFAGLQRYATATWSGDIGTRWEDMQAQITAGLNYSVAGLPYWTQDIGGFCVENRYVAGQNIFDRTGQENADLKEWRELNARWYQFGAFNPLFRAHGQFPLREAFNIAPDNHPAYKTIVYYTKLRYYMMPYIYSLAGATYTHDYTIMRPLVMDFGTDRKVLNIGHQYMFGPSFMVCPVTKYEARTLDVYFPQGKGWYDFYNGKYIAGGQQLTEDAPYEKMPLYVRAGSVVPYGELMQYTAEKPNDKITIYVYAGDNGKFTLYEDEGVNYNYENGKFAVIPMAYDDASNTLTIGKREGSFDGMLQNRTFNVVYVTKDAPKGFDPQAKGVQVNYTGTEQNIKLS
ncbi:MAG: DUF5110 domain-containing protein [Prevotellaceae bacterium]|jgi:alpha-D-xyloside xylohydrolase|nr:DUF5110 domain-containing protein [Prevotellaceae bacterium]